MPLSDFTTTTQIALAEYCRSGQLPENLPGARPERLPHYRRLVINVIKDALQQAYPLTRILVGSETFDQLSEEFFANHRCQHEQLFNMTGELVTYMDALPEHPLRQQHVFLMDLLRFEWLEMELYMAEDLPHPPIKEITNLAQQPLVLNPMYRLLPFNFRVFTQQAKHISAADAGQYYCLAHRHPASFKVIFTELSPLMVVVVEQLAQGQTLQHMYKLFAEADSALNSAQQHGILAGVSGLVESGFVLGAMPNH